MANPCYTQIHPPASRRSDEFQSKLTLMSESLAQRRSHLGSEGFGDTRAPDQIPEEDRDYYLERRYPAFGNLVPRDVASRASKREVRRRPGCRPAQERRVPRLRRRDQPPRSSRHRRSATATCSRCTSASTGEDPYVQPMRIYPPVHYTMGGLWVDYNLMSNVPGLYVLGEANFSDHGANRLGAAH